MTARISSIPGKTRAHRARLQWRILLKSQFDRLCEALQRFFFGLTLAICSRNLGTVCNEPRTILLDDCCKFVCHGVPCCSDSLSQRTEERTVRGCPFNGPTTALAVLHAGSVRHLQEVRLADLLQEDRRRRARRVRGGEVPAAGGSSTSDSESRSPMRPGTPVTAEQSAVAACPCLPWPQ